jgi:hypothetical protein
LKDDLGDDVSHCMTTARREVHTTDTDQLGDLVS